MNLLNGNKENCCGCTACQHICPQRAIAMLTDDHGFKYPSLDEELCNHCGRCKRVCAFQTGYDTSDNLARPDAYAVKHKDIDVRMKSRSGGMFTAVSEYILDNDGVVYGVGYKNHFVVCHKRAVTVEERNEFRGSKYVQSELGDIFFQVKNDLLNNKMVLFSGTPCQTAGLNSYLKQMKINKDKLILCDLVCHGTPSPDIWKDYITFIEKKYDGVVTDVDFRNKSLFGWSAHRESFNINKSIVSEEIFTKLFYRHFILRPSCFQCIYTNMLRPSDITLADYWGIDEMNPAFNDDKGVSLILINTEKGKLLFEQVNNRLDSIDCTNHSFIHPNLKKPTEYPKEYDQFWRDYLSKGFRYITVKYMETNMKDKVIKIVKKEVLVPLRKRFGL